jgi:hypothetical protein
LWKIVYQASANTKGPDQPQSCDKHDKAKQAIGISRCLFRPQLYTETQSNKGCSQNEQVKYADMELMDQIASLGSIRVPIMQFSD